MKTKKLKKAIKDLWERIDWVQQAEYESQQRTDKQIKMLMDNVFTDAGFNRITELAKRVTRETERINRLRDQVERMSENFTTKIDEVDRRIKGWMAVAERADQRSLKLENNAGVVASQSTDRVLDAHNERISRLESRLNAYGVPEGEYQDRTPEADEFSPPIGANPEKTGVVGDFEGERRMKISSPPHNYGPSAHPLDSENARNLNEERDRIVGAEAMRREAYERGLSAGSAKALQNAERRVRKYLTAYDFNETFIDGLVREMLGPVGELRSGTIYLDPGHPKVHPSAP
ncbi:MAG: hypothetical protein ABW022_10960 [Actinoplanes sp.]